MKTTEMKYTLRALAALLSYPDAELRAHVPDLRAALVDEGALSAARVAELDALLRQLERARPLEAEAEYVELFDRGRATSLHLFEHVHGDSRDRGPAMVDLGQTYSQAGLDLAPDELPDYLPAVLEFASTQPAPAARDFLAETAHILNAIFNALETRGSRYAAVLNAAVELAGEKVRAVKLPPEPEIDEAWTEPEPFGGCSSAGQSRPEQPQTVQFVRKADMHTTGAAQ
ncbi:nitrate reductase molybdenum cofactor assembly chaperone [Pseudazoarcus pumilus]|nr:nitrate reductase molybdenum cofactor assembly chaperone [Pseudazoarcus pumilus]